MVEKQGGTGEGRRSAAERRRVERAARAEAARRSAARRRLLGILGGAVAVAVVVVAGLILANRPEGGGEPIATAAPLAAEIPTEGRLLGDPAAPVTVVEWGDYQ